MNIKIEIGCRLKEFGLSRYSDLGAFAKELHIAPSQLSQYIHGRSKPGNKTQERLREMGCDLNWLMTGKTTEEVNKEFYGSKVGRSLKYKDEHFDLLDYLLSIGIDSKEKIEQIMKPIYQLADQTAKYKTKRKGR